ncbi:MAG: thiolase family protein [Gammaproteobacteria bacterium]|uniref:thiolase family protein n=1 Tax=Pseudomaricurvus alcaniphilus TaxID=1166482 RepID=UPI00140ABBE8|nr:thiolase family protein [Pseudomaricurvus alcaniphilus]MBR9910839.1 thiolase family protein [Gammaproteobacteria bacterium]NHN37283.1 thiolase family protein [Pseudomaricurvus alcaniphilus]
MNSAYSEKQCIISGVGQSEIGRRLPRNGLQLTIDAVKQALDDAGLSRADIDGVSSWPGQLQHAAPGFSPVAIGDLREAMDLKLSWYNAGYEATQMSAVLNACLAVASGQARHVICFRTMTEASSMAKGIRSSVLGTGSQRISGTFQWQLPFGAFSASSWIALVASRYMHEFGATREQLAQIALTARSNAMLNERAIYRDPLSLDDYLASRMISDPLCLFDCDVPIDGSTVIIVSHRDCAPDLKSKPVHIEAIAGPLYGRDSWDQQADLTRFAAEDAGKMLWSRTDFRPKDVDFAELYDGFSFLTLLWLEGLGFCERGEAAAFVEGGERISRDGQLPLATHGGQLSAGRTHGMGYFHEAVKQLRGEAGSHQLAGERKLAVVSNGGGNLAGAALLRRE